MVFRRANCGKRFKASGTVLNNKSVYCSVIVVTGKVQTGLAVPISGWYRTARTSGREKHCRMRMILSNMNDVIPSLDYSDENGEGSVEALKVIRDLYSEMLKQA